MKKLLLAISVCLLLSNCATAGRTAEREAKRQEEIAQKKAKIQKMVLEHRKKIRLKCPKIYEKVRTGTIFISMREECLFLSLGHPMRTNTSTSRVGTLNQHVYRTPRIYVYVLNGKITSWSSR